MAVYLAGPVADVCRYRDELTALGIAVRARWDEYDADVPLGRRIKFHLGDLACAHMAVFVLDEEGGLGGSPELYAVLGAAIARDRPLLLVGAPDSMLSGVTPTSVCQDWAKARAMIVKMDAFFASPSTNGHRRHESTGEPNGE